MISPTLQASVSDFFYYVHYNTSTRPPDHLIIIHPLMHLIQNRNRLLLLLVLVTSFLICSYFNITKLI